MYYVLWPFYNLFGGSTDALHLAAWLHNFLFAALALKLLRRQKREFASSFGIVLTLLLVFWGPTVLCLPWNPYLALMPFVLFVVMAVLACDTTRGGGLASLALVGSYLIQLHVSYLPIVALAIVGIVVWQTLRGKRGHYSHHSLILWILILLVWVPPIIALLHGVRGNLWDMTLALMGSSSVHAGTLRESMALLGEFPSWVLGLQSSPFPVHGHQVPVFTVSSALGIGLLLALWANPGALRSWARSIYILGTLLMVWAIASVLLVTGPALHYLFVWIPLIPGLFLWLRLNTALKWSWRRTPKIGTTVSLGVAMVCLIVAFRSEAIEKVLSRQDPNAQTVKRVSDSLENAAEDLNQTWIHVVPEGAQWNLLLVSVRNELSKRGFTATTELSFTALPPSNKGTTPGHSFFVMRSGDPAVGDTLLCRVGDLCLSLRRAPMVEYGKGWGPWEPGDFRWASRKDADLVAHYEGSANLTFEVASSEFMVPVQELKIKPENAALKLLRLPARPWTWVETTIPLPNHEMTRETTVRFQAVREWREVNGTRVMVVPIRNAKLSLE
jgi:hypothetical protein